MQTTLDLINGLYDDQNKDEIYKKLNDWWQIE